MCGECGYDYDGIGEYSFPITRAKEDVFTFTGFERNKTLDFWTNLENKVLWDNSKVEMLSEEELAKVRRDYSTQPYNGDTRRLLVTHDDLQRRYNELKELWNIATKARNALEDEKLDIELESERTIASQQDTILEVLKRAEKAEAKLKDIQETLKPKYIFLQQHITNGPLWECGWCGSESESRNINKHHENCILE